MQWLGNAELVDRETVKSELVFPKAWVVVMPLEHEDKLECWCEPEIDYYDPETGACVIVHRERH